ncbi:MAG: MacB family efflux pump subunit [Deltaproteobacteria bacterium]|jgi:macrolide transport system ATP-binding/permease protein|nr:MacB family efflux pump subunit [Deltaproteobacteria bacterium]
MSIITIRKLNKVYGQPPTELHVLKDIDLSIDRGEFVAIVGQSGSGKSTLMNMLGCLDTPTSGSYLIDGAEVGGMDKAELADLRSRTFGFIFQRYNLIGSLSALDNVAMPAVYAGVPHAERAERARQLMTELGLPDKFVSKPNELSGGQQQRVSIARALMNGGEVILADEPTGALDSASGENVMGILEELNRRGHTVILVTHDRQIASYARRRIELKDGVVIADTSDNRQAPTPGERENRAFTRGGRLHVALARLTESFTMSIQAILSHKMRSLLTMLGIIIGIAAVVSVVALGRGSQEKILSDISSIGTNTITVYPGEGYGDMRSGRVKTLTVHDADMLGRQSYLDSSTPQVSASGVLVYRNISVNAQLNGAGAQYFDVRGLKIDLGRLYNAEDVRTGASVAVIDPNTRNKLFTDGENPVGQVLVFNRQPLRIIGVTKKQETVFGPTDTLNLWAPYTTVMHKITGQSHISSIVVKVSDDVSSQVAEKNLTTFLTAKHGKKDFFTSNSDSIKQTVESTTGTMTVLISSIALISLIVGGIGVMNIMLVSVTERTREIGIRMAIGARQYNILEQFLLEAVLICLAGGAAGIALSGVVGFVFSLFVQSFALAYSLSSFLVALGCSTLIGVVFGFMPARNASELNPIEALARD